MSFERSAESGGTFVLDSPENVPALWGQGDDVLWAQGEPLMICGPQGVGKTTLAQQLALALAGVLEPTLLGFPVARETRPVLYIAADRPSQAARSMRRMVSEEHREALDYGLVIWRGPLPFRLADDPAQLAEWASELRVGTIVIDSLKDVAVGLAEDAVGAAVNQALQEVVACDIEVVDLHHQRKGQDGHKPRKLDDVFGSTWLTAGHGSVLLVWGEPGDPYVELTHLKQPAAEVGPLTIRHDHARGRSTLPEAVDLLDLAASGVTATEAAQSIYDTSSPNRNQRERARRRLEKLADAGRVTRQPGAKASEAVTYWLACVTPRDPSRDPVTATVTQGHDWALTAVTEGVTQGHALRNGTGHPLKGAEPGSARPPAQRLSRRPRNAGVGRTARSPLLATWRSGMTRRPCLNCNRPLVRWRYANSYCIGHDLTATAPSLPRHGSSHQRPKSATSPSDRAALGGHPDNGGARRSFTASCPMPGVAVSAPTS